ncbi:hypothetical protein ACYU03_11730 [Pseudomonas sp. X10]
MPIDLRALPAKLAMPPAPRHGRWWLVILLGSLMVAGLLVLFWPQDRWYGTPWFWSCVLGLPVMTGLLTYGVRLKAHERRCQYVQSWNRCREQQEQQWLQRGQRPVALLDAAYCTPLGSSRMAQALREGRRCLQPVYLEHRDVVLPLSRLLPAAERYTRDEYKQRLQGCLERVASTLAPALQGIAGNRSVQVRIRHNQILEDEEVVNLWRAVDASGWASDQGLCAMRDDGWLWLDEWLDQPEPTPLVLALAISLHLDPVAGEAESVSAVLLAHPDQQVQAPLAWVHRPVRIGVVAQALEDCLNWGCLAGERGGLFCWKTQMPDELSHELAQALSTQGFPPTGGSGHDLDGSFGLAGCAVGNMALISAAEQAGDEGQPQLLMLRDASAQLCVVRPVCGSRMKVQS